MAFNTAGRKFYLVGSLRSHTSNFLKKNEKRKRTGFQDGFESWSANFKGRVIVWEQFYDYWCRSHQSWKGDSVHLRDGLRRRRTSQMRLKTAQSLPQIPGMPVLQMGFSQRTPVSVPRRAQPKQRGLYHLVCILGPVLPLAVTLTRLRMMHFSIIKCFSLSPS